MPLFSPSDGAITPVTCVTTIEVFNAERILSMSKRGRRELVSRLSVLFAHLLKWQFQPGRDRQSWQATIREQRSRIRHLLNREPGLKHLLDDEQTVHKCWENGLDVAASETGLEITAGQRWSLDNVLDDDFWPD